LGDEDDQLADDYNKVLRWCDDRDGFQEYLSQAFEGSCDTGMTLLHMYPDYTNDPISGDLSLTAYHTIIFLLTNITANKTYQTAMGSGEEDG